MHEPSVFPACDCVNPPNMSQGQDEGDWGFGPAISLINALSVTQTSGPIRLVPPDSNDKPARADSHQSEKLGFLDEVWTLLGKPPEFVFGQIVAPLTPDVPQTLRRDDKIKGSNEKGVRWQDQVKAYDVENKEAEFRKVIHVKSNKTQRKKENRRCKRELSAKLGAGPFTPPTSSDDNSEDESAPWQRSSERRSIIQQLIRPNQDIHTASEDLLATKSICSLAKATKSTGQNGQLVPPSYTPLHCRLAPILTPKPEKLQSLARASTKKSKLLKKLQAKFAEDRISLSNLGAIVEGPRSDQVDVSNSIHVFVDASNIMIGFHDSLKLARGLSFESRIRHQPFSFHNLSLILERGRPTAKRVLVGSDNFSAIQEAKLIGYETNILDRVHKAKELTPRQKRLRKRNLVGTSGPSSGSETPTTTYTTHTPEKWVEQGVDEILHLKMLESLVDAKSPSTIILATGDAAEAEYSQGFLKMVERALERGWKVELVSFRHNTSWAYKKTEFRSQWGKSFKLIELDEFVEELLGA